MSDVRLSLEGDFTGEYSLLDAKLPLEGDLLDGLAEEELSGVLDLLDEMGL